MKGFGEKKSCPGLECLARRMHKNKSLNVRASSSSHRCRYQEGKVCREGNVWKTFGGRLPKMNSNEQHVTRVLVVDDNRAAARLLGMIIQMHGCEVRTAGDGRQAIQIADEFRPQIILMDLGMPKMNGFEAAKYLRRQAWGQSMLLVATTGSADEDDKQQTAEAGFNVHLVKPVNPEEIPRLLLMQAALTTAAPRLEGSQHKN